MNVWGFLCKHVEKIYRRMFLLGIVLLIFSRVVGILSLKLVLSLFPIVGGITAAYLWIRLDVWHTDKTINELTSPNDIAANELRSRRADSRVALFLLMFVAISQSLLQDPKSNWSVLFGTLFTLLPLSNWIARSMERSQN